MLHLSDKEISLIQFQLHKQTPHLVSTLSTTTVLSFVVAQSLSLRSYEPSKLYR